MNSIQLLAAVLSCLLAVQIVVAAVAETQEKAYSNLASLSEPYGVYDIIVPRDTQRYLSQFQESNLFDAPQKKAQSFVRFGKRSSDDSFYRPEKRAQSFVRFGRKWLN